MLHCHGERARYEIAGCALLEVKGTVLKHHIPYVKYEGTARKEEVKLEAIEEEKKNEGEKIGIGMGNWECMIQKYREERGGLND